MLKVYTVALALVFAGCGSGGGGGDRAITGPEPSSLAYPVRGVLLAPDNARSVSDGHDRLAAYAPPD